MYWLWLFCLYSFLGYLLEKIFAAVTGSRHQVRKCFLLLPLCPVYGLAMLAVLHLPADLTRGFLRLAFYGGLTATAVEYAVHFLYDKLLGVMFWDYSGTHMDLNRRVCVPFAVVWGPLTAFALRQVQPLLHPIALHAPAGAGLALLLVLTADSFFTVRLLRRTHNVDRYMADPLCGADATVGLFRQMLRGLRFNQTPRNIDKMDKDAPILLIAGQDDPVGDMGAGVRRTHDAFKRAGIRDVTLKLYPGLRHEILNEAAMRDTVYGDIGAWLDRVLG